MDQDILRESHKSEQYVSIKPQKPVIFPMMLRFMAFLFTFLLAAELYWIFLGPLPITGIIDSINKTDKNEIVKSISSAFLIPFLFLEIFIPTITLAMVIVLAKVADILGD